MKNFFKGILDFIIPPLCVSCENTLAKGENFLCGKCSEMLVRYNTAHPWQSEYKSRGIIDNSFSLYRFVKDTPVQHLLHSMKYEKMKSIGTKLGVAIAKTVPNSVKYDFAVPVPLHKVKSRERTYNQSEYICKGIIEITGAEVVPKLLLRNRFTKSQTRLDRAARMENVKDAFKVNPKYKNIISRKNFILADDVITTGATILECAKILKENGAGYVMICSAAYDALD